MKSLRPIYYLLFISTYLIILKLSRNNLPADHLIIQIITNKVLYKLKTSQHIAKFLLEYYILCMAYCCYHTFN